jgi:hypothetical protein
MAADEIIERADEIPKRVAQRRSPIKRHTSKNLRKNSFRQPQANRKAKSSKNLEPVIIGSLNEYESILHLNEARVQIGFRKRSPRHQPATTIMLTKVKAEIIIRHSIAV